MSSVDKLSLLAVRSFGPQSPEVIQFFKPLTIIVGQNGCGKTTILEALKFAVTNQLPPNSKHGGVWIHDPQLTGEKEVLAQVRLSFLSTTGARMVATRNLQLTVKKTTRSQKTLEGSLLMAKDGERTVISTRVAELDQLLPQYLGVSTAILDNVIFCHQDESLWPLSEPSVLKKKFDEIFEAMKYTKAIENIKQLRKKQNEELGKFKIIEQHSKENKERGEKARHRSEQLSDEIEALRKEKDELHAKAAEVGAKAAEAWTNEAQFTKIVEELKGARKSREWHQKQVDDLAVDLEVRSETDDLLRSELEQSAEREKAQLKLCSEKKEQYKSIFQEIERIRTLQSKKRVEAGRLEQQKSSHEGNLRTREVSIQNAAREYKIRGYAAELDDKQINEFIDRMDKFSKDQIARLERATRDNAAEVQKVQEAINELREQRSTLLESKKTAKQLMKDNDSKISTLHKDLETFGADEVGRATLASKIADLQSKIQNAKTQLTQSTASSDIREANKELQRLEIEISTLNRELIDNTKRAGDLARLDHLRKETQDRQHNLSALQSTYGDRLRTLVGRDWDIATLEKDFQSILESKKEDVSTAEQERDIVARQLEQVEYKLKLGRGDLKKKRDELQSSAHKVKELADVDPDEYSDALSEAVEDRDAAKAEVDNYENMYKYFEEAVEIVTKHHVCRLCRRGFEDEKSAQQFVANLKKLLSQKAQKKAQETLEKLEEYLPRCREAGKSYDTWKRLSEKEIPALEGEISKNEKERENSLEELERHDTVVKDKEALRRDAETLSKPVASMSKCKSELDNYMDQSQALASKQGSATQERSLDELQVQIEALNNKAKDQRLKLAKLQQEDQSLRDKHSALEIELGTENAKLVKIDHELEKKMSIAEQISEFKNAIQVQTEIVVGVESELSELGSRMSEEAMRMEDVKSRHKKTESDLQRAANSLMDTLRDLQRMHREVQQYIDQGGPLQLARCQREIETLGQEISSREGEAKQVTIKINEIQEDLNSKDKQRRNITDNLKYRKMTRELASLEEEIERLAAQNAEADQDYHARDAERLRKEHQALLAEETSKVERMKVRDDQLLQLLQDWETDYKDADLNYKKAHIEVETTKAAVQDLGVFGAALDKAIMKYHTLKMEEINRIIEELWRRTYQGTDVDTILIRSDNETARGNRAYNYRVCMVKQDAEMDMRGRCSAGQKVLASIIIRLALAECFGVNCGMIALDEPTTNLDRDNICSLAESLHHIIWQRRQQSNFQLIIITHDEDFLRSLRPAEFCDHYYRLSRNDRQKSIIERQSISEVQNA